MYQCWVHGLHTWIRTITNLRFASRYKLESLLVSFSSFCACFSLFWDGRNSHVEHDTHVYLALLALTFLVSLIISILIPKYEEYLQVSDITIRVVDLLCLTYRMYFLINCKPSYLCKISDALRTKALTWHQSTLKSVNILYFSYFLQSLDRIG